MTDPALYKSLRNTETVELVVYGSRTRCFHNDAFIEDGRPHALSAISLNTWSLLSSNINGYRIGVISYSRKFVLLPLLFFYVALVGTPILIPDPDVFWIVQLAIIAIFMFMMVFVVRRLVGNHLENDFHPAVTRVVDELRPAISENGFEVEYVVEPGWRRRSVLRFHRKEEEP